MALDRESTLKKAEKLLRQGRLDLAIEEYLRVVEDQPRDWNTANLLGDLYVRAGQTDKALGQYVRIADHFTREGFYPKAAALYKKILKINPDDESTQLQLAEVSARQGLLADAKTHLNTVANRRRARGDRRGAAEIVVRLASLDPTDFDARLVAAQTLAEMGEESVAAELFRALHDDLLEKGRTADALDALRQVVRLSPQDRDGRAALARAAIEAGDVVAAREFLDRETAGNDPALLAALVDVEVRAGRLDRARDLLREVLSRDKNLRPKFIELAWSVADADPDAAFVCIDGVADAATAVSNFSEAASVLQEFAARVPRHVPALLKLVEVCVDGGLESTMYEAQARLTDAYLDAGRAAEARVIAEDLVAREPWERPHIERFRRALTMLRVSDPDTVIAERLSGQTPFIATDPFAAETGPQEPARVHAAEAQTPDESVSVAAAKADTAPGPSSAAAHPSSPEGSGAGAASESPEIDLTNVLSDLRASAPQSPSSAPREEVEEVFHGLREQAAEDGRDLSAQYMKLARTYLEMGMLDEAMASLRTAAQSPHLRFEAASTLGRLHSHRGDAAHAIEWLERAAEVPAPTVEEGRTLLYDLGVTLDRAGEIARALAVFLELQADAGDYRDVPARIDRLARVQTGG